MFGQARKLFNTATNFFFGNTVNDQKPGTVKKHTVNSLVKLNSSVVKSADRSRDAKHDKENLTTSFHEMSIDGDASSPQKSKKGANVNFAYEP